MTGRIDKTKRRIFIEYTADRQLKRALKNTPGYKCYAGEISVPALQENIDSLKELGYMVEGKLPPELRPHDESWKNSPKLSVQPLNGKEYRSHQNNVIPFLLSREKSGSGMLTWSPGAGKTMGSLAFLGNLPHTQPVLFIVPANIKKQWQKAIKDVLGWKVDIIYSQTANTLDKTKSYIINYEILPYWIGELNKVKFRTIISDEPHKYIGNNQKTKTKEDKTTGDKEKTITRTGAFFKVVKPKHDVIFLTGSGYRSKPHQLYPMLHFLAPELFPSLGEFRNNFCNWVYMHGTITYLPGAKEPEILGHLLKHVAYSVAKEDVAEMPEKERVVVDLDINTADYIREEREILKQNKIDAKELQEFIEFQIRQGNDELASNVVEQYLLNNRYKSEALTAAVDQLSRSAFAAKKTAVVDWIETFLDSGLKLCVFVHHHAAAHYLQNAFKKQSVLFIGGMPQKQRQASLDGFLKDKQLLIGNPDALTGLDGLQDVCWNNAFAEFSASLDMLQGEERFYRVGQSKKCTSYLLIGTDTADEYRLKMFESDLIAHSKIIGT